MSAKPKENDAYPARSRADVRAALLTDVRSTAVALRDGRLSSERRVGDLALDLVLDLGIDR